jgi:hypothetical protein
MPSHSTPPTAAYPAVANPAPKRTARSVLAWPAWQRAALVVPVLGLLWLAVAWASLDVVPL